jgi:hypothetical protein
MVVISEYIKIFNRIAMNNMARSIGQTDLVADPAFLTNLGILYELILKIQFFQLS